MSFLAVILVLVGILELIGLGSVWMEVKHSNRSSQFLAFQQQIANLSNQLNRAQADMSSALLDLAEFEIKAGNKEKARTLLEKVTSSMRDARWVKLSAQCGPVSGGAVSEPPK